jgi:CRISPR/Cas system CSM-associated protein Csm3 (group 7 of RAMP superfamily)
MKKIEFTLQLTSDAEPGTGLGSNLLNDFIPRDHRGLPEIPASHLKGLMRFKLAEIVKARNWPPQLIHVLFGKSDHRLPEQNSAIALTSAALDQLEHPIHQISRTKIAEWGVAEDKSLRTTESIPAQTRFRGSVITNTLADSVEDLAWRLALVSITAIGSKRNRGSGACIIEIKNESRGPGQLLKQIDPLIKNWNSARLQSPNTDPQPRQSASEFTGPGVPIRVRFRALTPICCPETADRSNILTTGFSIPASTVQGAILSALNARNPELADGLFRNSCFRAWALQPIEMEDNGWSQTTATRVSLTHKVAKYSLKGAYSEEDFDDEALRPRTSEFDRPAGAPLKGSDGVLRRHTDGSISLWRSSDMPHLITAHGVHRESITDEVQRGRNLFTVDAMVPMVWQGIMVIPYDAMDGVIRHFEESPLVAIGKSKTVRGLGEISLQVIDGIPEEWKTHSDRTVWIAQSPFAVPVDIGVSLENHIQERASQWMQLMKLDPVKPNQIKVWATNGILFGFNRMLKGLQPAQRTILPGAVIDFGIKLPDQAVFELWKSGDFLADQRLNGYGNFLVHPGIATSLYQPAAETAIAPPGSDDFAEAVRLVLEISRCASLPSSSQIRSLQSQIAVNAPQPTRPAIDYLDLQLEGRTERIWADWKQPADKLKTLLTKYPLAAYRALDVLADLVVAKE